MIFSYLLIFSFTLFNSFHPSLTINIFAIMFSVSWHRGDVQPDNEYAPYHGRICGQYCDVQLNTE